MAGEKTLTDKILDNIVSTFTNIQKDITEAKKAIEAAGVSSSGITKNLSDEIIKIQTKVETDIKDCPAVPDIGGYDIVGGFGVIKNSQYGKYCKEYTIIPNLNYIDFKVPDDNEYMLAWPNIESMKSAKDKLYSLQSSQNESISGKYADLTVPLVKMNFTKNNLPYLSNTSYKEDLYKYKNNKSEHDNPSYNLEVYVTADNLVTSNNTPKDLVDTYRLDMIGVSTDNKFIENTDEGVHVSLPSPDSDFFINNNKVESDAIIKTDTFVSSAHINVKAVICKNVIFDILAATMARLVKKNINKNSSADPIRIYIDETVTEPCVLPSTERNASTETTPEMVSFNDSHIALGHSLCEIYLNKSDDITEWLKNASKQLSLYDILFLTYDQTEYFSYDCLKWMPVSEISKDISGPYLYNSDVGPSSYYIDNDSVHNYISIKYGIKNQLPCITFNDIISRIDSVYDSKEGSIVSFYDFDNNKIHLNENSAILVNNTDKKWKFTNEIDCSWSNDKFINRLSRFEGGSDHPMEDGKKVYTLDFTDVSEQTIRFPLLELDGNGESYKDPSKSKIKIAISTPQDHSITNRKYMYFVAPDYVYFVDINGNLLEDIHIDGYNELHNMKSTIPVFYNRNIKSVTISNANITLPKILLNKFGEKFNYSANKFFVADVPTSPTEWALNNCNAVEDIEYGPMVYGEYDKYAIKPSTADELAKRVIFIIDESDQIVNSLAARLYRFRFYNMDKTKKYNYSSKAWEEVANATPDDKLFSELYPEEYVSSEY